jgi:hypothetical protein
VISRTYRLDQIMGGEGLLASGATTLIYQLPDGLYITCATTDKVYGQVRLVGGGRLRASGRPVFTWVEGPVLGRAVR